MLVCKTVLRQRAAVDRREYGEFRLVLPYTKEKGGQRRRRVIVSEAKPSYYRCDPRAAWWSIAFPRSEGRMAGR